MDKIHPLFTVLNSPKKWKDYLTYFDIVSSDPYLGMNDRVSHAEYVKNWMQLLKKDIKSLQLTKNIWVVLPAFKLAPKNATVEDVYRKPTPAEFQSMVDVSLKEGVDGILVYTLAAAHKSPLYYEWDLPVNDPLLWNTVRRLPKDLIH